MEEQLEFNFDLYAIGPWTHVQSWYCRFYLYVEKSHGSVEWRSIAACLCDESWGGSDKLTAYIYSNADMGSTRIEHGQSTYPAAMEYIDKVLLTIKPTGYIRKKKV